MLTADADSHLARIGAEPHQAPRHGATSDSKSTPCASTNGTSHRTYFADANNDGVGEVDNDYFSFTAVPGTAYTIETLNLWSKANTSLQLLAGDGVTVLASNDNRAVGDDSSLISYTATGSGTLYVRSFHAPDLGVYGSYDLRLSSVP